MQGTREQVAEGERYGVEGQGTGVSAQNPVFTWLISLLFLLVIYLADYEESLSEKKDLKSHR
jgi:hypothetical protein